jgi:hypothetical protein
MHVLLLYVPALALLGRELVVLDSLRLAGAVNNAAVGTTCPRLVQGEWVVLLLVGSGEILWCSGRQSWDFGWGLGLAVRCCEAG